MASRRTLAHRAAVSSGAEKAAAGQLGAALLASRTICAALSELTKAGVAYGAL